MSHVCLSLGNLWMWGLVRSDYDVVVNDDDDDDDDEVDNDMKVNPSLFPLLMMLDWGVLHTRR